MIEAFNAGEKWMEIEKSHTERPVLLDFFKRPFKKINFRISRLKGTCPAQVLGQCYAFASTASC